jgi:antitoxin VapB
MSLNIQHQRVPDLAREAARVTGKSQTAAIEEALVQLLRQHDADPVEHERHQKADRARTILDWFANNPGDLELEIRTTDDLFDEETGLPR